MVFVGSNGYICMSWSFFLILSLKYADASKLAPFGYFEIVTNVALGYYFFMDFPDGYTFLGLLIIISSGLYILIRERSLKPSVNVS